MQLSEMLSEKKFSILEKWIESVISEYSHDSSNFLKTQKDRFANPMGYNISHSLTELYNIVCDDYPIDTTINALEEFIKLRAVQDLSPSEAVAFVFNLKKTIRNECRACEPELLNELAGLEDRIDQVALMAFDLYLESRERLYRVRIDELKRGTHILTDGAVCPSALMRQNMQAKKDIKPINS